MRKFLLLTALVSSMVAVGQKAANPTVYANSITVEELKKHLYIVRFVGFTIDLQRQALQ